MVWMLVVGVSSLSLTVSGQPNPGSPTTQWVPVGFGMNGTVSDPSGDQQNGTAELDLIGNAREPSVYMQYASGYLGFRVRLGGDTALAGFRNHSAFIGLDANLNGSLDLLLGVNNRAAGNQIGIWMPGAGANTSPGSTSVGALFKSYTETATTYGFAPVTPALDPTATNFDLNADGRTDQFLSFFVPFADIVSALSAENIAFTTNSLMDLVALTTTRINALNGDIAGVAGGIGSNQSWSQLGAFSRPIAPAPEPSPLSFFVLAGFMAVLSSIRWR